MFLFPRYPFIHIFYIFFICSFLLSSCFDEYRDHHLRETFIPQIIASSGSSLSGEIFILPSTDILKNIVASIDHAQKKIWVEIYMWTEKSTIDAIVRAKKRGVDVRVILEGNVYGTPFINKNTFNIFSGASIPIVYADNSRYTFTHTKFWIIDDRWCIATGNLTYSSFTKNRDMIYCAADPLISKNLTSLFLADFEHKKPIFLEGIDARLGISSINMRPWLEKNLETSKNILYVYNQSITDPQMLGFFDQKEKSGTDVAVCSADISDPDDGNDLSDTSMKYPFPFVSVKKPYPHLKLFLLDHDTFIIGSINLTQNALDNNRETAFLIENNPKLYSQVKNIFLQDCFPEKVAKK